MKMSSKWVWLLLLSSIASAQDARVLDAARSTIAAARFCFLITLDSSGQPQARLMNPFDPEPDMTIWMGTNRKTRKVEQIRKNPRVTLAYPDIPGSGYVTLIGKARLVDSLEERRRRWKKEWADFYPGGPEGDTYLLIEFKPERIEVMSLAYKIASEPLAWKPAILEKTYSNRKEGSWRRAR